MISMKYMARAECRQNQNVFDLQKQLYVNGYWTTIKPHYELFSFTISDIGRS